MAGIVYGNICAEHGLEIPRTKWDTPHRVVVNDQAKSWWAFQIKVNKLVMANQPVVVDKQEAIVIHVAIIPS